MKSFVVFATIMACAAAAPGLSVAHEPVVAVATPVVHSVPVVAQKTTITKSSQVVNHGTPIHTVHAAPVIAAAPVVVKAAPVIHTVHAAPIVHTVHATPIVVKTAPAAITHSSSIVRHAVPLVAVHH